MRTAAQFAAAVVVTAAACAGTESTAAPFLVLNCSGMPYETALQAAVLQGLLNRQEGVPSVWLADIAEGLGARGQQDGAGYPGAKFIEWKTGHAGTVCFRCLSLPSPSPIHRI